MSSVFSDLSPSHHDNSRKLARTDTYFLSDLHLGASYIADGHEAERRVVRWLRSVAPTARAIYLVGDVLDYWFEYRAVVPKGFARFFGALAEIVDSGVEVTWLIGNHDIWIFGYLQQELGVRVVDGALVEEIDGRRFFIEHGDGVGEHRPSYRRMRAIFRSRLLQRLYAALPSNWTVPFAHAWSSSSRSGQSDEYDAPSDVIMTSLPPTDSLLRFSRGYLADASHPHIDYFVFGHKHIMADCEVGEDSRMIILGDWIRRFSYARWDGHTLALEIFKDDNAD